jgi:hypothetical protein
MRQGLLRISSPYSRLPDPPRTVTLAPLTPVPFNLLALGPSKWQAIRTGLSSKAHRHLSRTLATETGMSNDWLKSRGSISIRDLWVKQYGHS